jgi:hypothetical protein
MTIVSRKLPARRNINAVRKISIPNNIQMPLFLFEAAMVFRTAGIECTFYDTLGGKSVYCLLPHNGKSAYYEFTLNPLLTRNESRASLFINDFALLPDSMKAYILEYEPDLSVLLTPTVKERNLLPQLLENGREYAIFIPDDMDEPTFRLNSRLPQKTVLASARTIVRSFPNSAFILLNTGGDCYTSPFFPDVKKILIAAGIMLTEKNLLTIADGADEFESFAAISKYITGTTDSPRVILLPYNSYVRLKPKLTELKKSGLRFTKYRLVLQEQ